MLLLWDETSWFCYFVRKTSFEAVHVCCGTTPVDILVSYLFNSLSHAKQFQKPNPTPLVHKFIRLDVAFGNNISLLKWRVRKSEWRLYHLTFSPPPPPWRGRTCLINLSSPISIANRGISLTGYSKLESNHLHRNGNFGSDVDTVNVDVKRYWTRWPWSTNFSEGINGEEDF